MQNNEIFYTCAWSVDSDAQNVLLAAAGARGIVRILSPNNAEYYKHLVGHTQAINEIKFHPKLHHILLSASKDHSLRLWNVQTNVCLAVFGGADGHRDEVLSADFDILGDRIVSGSMDHSVKVWRLNKPDVLAAIARSDEFQSAESTTQFETLLVFAPDYSTRQLHCNYVDSVMWLGDFILSKVSILARSLVQFDPIGEVIVIPQWLIYILLFQQSCEQEINCWTSDKLWETTSLEDKWINVIHRFSYDESELWYIRFSLDPECKYLAVGHENGKIFVWHLGGSDMSIKRFVLSRKNCVRCVRQIAFSHNGHILVGVCDNGSIWRWDHKDSR